MKQKIKTPADDTEQTDSEGEIRVKNMMCEHCEKRVKDCLEALPFVEEAVADYQSGKVKLKLSSAPDEKKMKKALKEAGYPIIK